MRSILVAGAALLVLSSSAVAQSCALADSVVGSKIDKKAYRVEYDKMTDSTRLEGREKDELGGMLMLGPSGDFSFDLWYPGKKYQGNGQVFIGVEARTASAGAVAADALKDAAHYDDVETMRMLIDDSVRVSLPRVSYDADLDGYGSRVQLVERMLFTVPMEELPKIGNGDEIEVEVGELHTKFGDGQTRAAREFYRVLACPPPA